MNDLPAFFEPVAIHRDDVMEVVQERNDLERLANKLREVLWLVLDDPEDPDHRFKAQVALRRYELWQEALEQKRADA